MFIASILPALFACVLGVDESVEHLESNSNITFPFINLRKPQSVLHAKAVFEEGSKSTSCVTAFYRSAPNTDFIVPLPDEPRPQSVFHGKLALREGSTSNPCEIGEPCYQSLTDREFALLGGSPNGGTGIIVAYPVDRTKSPSAIIVRKKGETSADSSIPVHVGVTERIELNTTVPESVLIWYADRVQDTTSNENIEFVLGDNRPLKRYVYLPPYLNEGTKEMPLLVLTGRLGTTEMDYKFMFSDSKCGSG